MNTIKDTVERTLGFHGQRPDAITTSIIDALELREQSIQADLLEAATNLGMDEDEALDLLRDVFANRDGDTEPPSFDAVLASITILTRVLAEQTALLGTLA